MLVEIKCFYGWGVSRPFRTVRLEPIESLMLSSFHLSLSSPSPGSLPSLCHVTFQLNDYFPDMSISISNLYETSPWTHLFKWVNSLNNLNNFSAEAFLLKLVL